MSMVTDPQRIKKTDSGRPNVCSVFSYHKIFHPTQAEEIKESCKKGGRGCTECKSILAKFLIEFLHEFRIRRKSWEGKPEKLKEILEEGKVRAGKVAAETLKDVRHKMGVT